MRSIDTLDELEESDLELNESDKSDASTPPCSEDSSNQPPNDLDRSCDSYGVRIEVDQA